MHVASLFVYPVKSLRGSAVAEVRIDELGIVGDRRFLVVDANDRFLTQRTLPRMALIETELTAEGLLLRAPGAGRVAVPLRAATRPQLRTVSIWRSHGLLAEDCGDEPAAWLSDVLATACRLVRVGDQFRRSVLRKPRYAEGVAPAAPELVEGRVVTSDLFAFADGYPFMILSEASLADLNARLVDRGEDPVPVDRFRPSLVVAGSPAFAEDSWRRIRIGGIDLLSAGPCARCIVTTTDQMTALRGPEPLRTLSRYRRDPDDTSNVNFGQNFVHETKSGTIRVGDPVTVAT